MSKPTLEPKTVPTDPDNWNYLGDHDTYLHFWTYTQQGKTTHECYIKKLSDTLYEFELHSTISGNKLAGRTITNAQIALDFADKMMTQIAEHNEIINNDFEWPN